MKGANYPMLAHGSNRMQMTKQMALIIEITLINRDEKCWAISKEAPSIHLLCKKSQCPRAGFWLFS